MLYVRIDELAAHDGQPWNTWSTGTTPVPADEALTHMDTVSLSRVRVLLNAASDEADEARKVARVRASVTAPARIDWSFLRDDIAQAVARGPKRPR